MDVVLGEPAQGCDEVHQVTEGEYIFMNSMAEFKLWKRDLWRAPTPGSVLVEFQAKADSSIMVALSCLPCQVEPYYAIVLGAFENSKSLIQKGGAGDVRAISNKSNVCSRTSFISYWILLQDGVLSCGMGVSVGDDVIVAWKDPEPEQVQYVSFATYSGSMRVRNISVDSAKAMLQSEIELSRFVPEHLEHVEEERVKARKRAKRFGLQYTQPSNLCMLDKQISPRSPSKKSSMSGGRYLNDSCLEDYTEEGIARRIQHCERYGVIDAAAERSKEIEAHKHALASRAKRFQLPTAAEQKKAEEILDDFDYIGLPKNMHTTEDSSESLLLYGNLCRLENDVYRWFKEFSIARVAWKETYCLNVTFQDEATAIRAWNNTAQRLPCANQFSEIRRLERDGWHYAVFDKRTFLVCRASSANQSSVLNNGKPKVSRARRKESSRRDHDEKRRNAEALYAGDKRKRASRAGLSGHRALSSSR